MPDERYQHIYLSPHLDDAALSCGGHIYQEHQAGLAVLVVTPLAGDAPVQAFGAPSPIIADLHTRWELAHTGNPVAVRRSEDRTALSLLGADVCHWTWPECVYRRHPETGEFLYPSEESLWVSLQNADEVLLARMARRLAELPLVPGGRLYLPLTVGEHVDHLLVRRAAEMGHPPEADLVYYEEYPYAERPEALAAALREEASWQPELVHLDETAVAAKSAAIACYQSQISTFFEDTAEIAARVRAYATVVGEGQGWAERYWHPGSQTGT
jgi:LmbE family N-acetylglucosaminyl deacetylase